MSPHCPRRRCSSAERLISQPAAEPWPVSCSICLFTRGNARAKSPASSTTSRSRPIWRQWTKKSVEQVLTNEKYIGDDVYNRRSGKLSKHRTAMPPESGSVQPPTDLACRPRMGCS
ncbi:MAG: hypothetical protein E6G83_06635 [Alphaproteobacteria bacterium]|nr:MAG: hypothetical protein E6G83_06635 [Alphaproteobacteria bacterium]